ncbi:MAG: glycosyl hydrolase 53 family protein [Bacteroidales bacterium]|nr:glycosyl hydrolase 53 family protein [Bacteroidales bacterium]
MIRKSFLLSFLLLFSLALSAQTYYFGNDLSYVNQMEDCGAVFKENGVEKDVYQIFADHGTNLVRVRLWHTPSWQNSLVQPDGVKSQYSDYEDVHETIQRAKACGMNVMMGFQFSDAWADPGRQVIPQAWLGVAYDLEALKDSVYNYVVKVLGDLHKDSLLPEIIKIGNETNSGMMYHETMNSNLDPSGMISNDWDRHAELYNAAIRAVRDFSDTTAIKPLIALHAADPDKVVWWYNNILNHGVTDFDIMGMSYYYSWHEGSIAHTGDIISQLRFEHPGYKVMIVETGYLWSQRNYDGMPNIITTADPAYLPVTPQKQLEYLIDLQRTVLYNGGIGIVFWEPAWVSTPCRTPWGQGSSHDHVVFFDPVNTNFMRNGGGRWAEGIYYENINSPKVTFTLNIGDQDPTNGVFLKGSWSDEYYPMLHLEDDLYQFTVYELNDGDSVGYYFLTDTSAMNRETIPSECAIWESTDRTLKPGPGDMSIELYWESCDNEPPVDAVNTLPEEQVQIYPNPAFDQLNILLPEKGTFRQINILDLNGRALTIDAMPDHSQEKTLDISTLPAGVYYLQLLGGDIVFYQKFIVI